jgi:DNA-binding response OmpR family regulator
MPKKLLIIEDEKDIQDLLQHYLKREGYEVEGVKDGDGLGTCGRFD